MSAALLMRFFTAPPCARPNRNHRWAHRLLDLARERGARLLIERCDRCPAILVTKVGVGKKLYFLPTAACGSSA